MIKLRKQTSANGKYLLSSFLLIDHDQLSGRFNIYFDFFAFCFDNNDDVHSCIVRD